MISGSKTNKYINTFLINDEDCHWLINMFFIEDSVLREIKVNTMEKIPISTHEIMSGNISLSSLNKQIGNVSLISSKKIKTKK